jgi:predicted aldo/keto reductase-like oxidoreductase
MSSVSIPDQLKVAVNLYTLETTYQFPKFIQLFALHYSISERNIMSSNGSKVLCRINAQKIGDFFLVSNLDINELEQFNQEECFNFYNQINQDDKFRFLVEFSKPDQPIVDSPLPYNVKVFQEPVQSLFSLLGQIFGHDDDT